MNILFSNYLSRSPIDTAMRNFGKKFSENQKVLDIGCGKKPYRTLFKCEYVGLDSEKSVNPDIVANAWKIPLPSESFDGIILNQSLEHIAETQASVKEIWRLLKPGGAVIVTVPHTMRTHSSPISASEAPVKNFNSEEHTTWRVDYFRFTKFGLIYAFKDFKTLSVKETNGYIGTLLQLVNYFLASIGPNWLFTPIYLVNNIIGLTTDELFKFMATLPIPIFKKLYDYVYTSITINYIGIFEKTSN